MARPSSPRILSRLCGTLKPWSSGTTATTRPARFQAGTPTTMARLTGLISSGMMSCHCICRSSKSMHQTSMSQHVTMLGSHSLLALSSRFTLHCHPDTLTPSSPGLPLWKHRVCRFSDFSWSPLSELSTMPSRSDINTLSWPGSRAAAGRRSWRQPLILASLCRFQSPAGSPFPCHTLPLPF